MQWKLLKGPHGQATSASHKSLNCNIKAGRFTCIFCSHRAPATKDSPHASQHSMHPLLKRTLIIKLSHTHPASPTLSSHKIAAAHYCKSTCVPSGGFDTSTSQVGTPAGSSAQPSQIPCACSTHALLAFPAHAPHLLLPAMNRATASSCRCCVTARPAVRAGPQSQRLVCP